MSGQSVDELRDTAIAAVSAVGAQLSAAFRTPMRVDSKYDARDLVTEHDTAAELVIRELIGRRWPEATIVGEEFGGTPNTELVWYIDPIDGTGAFVQGLAFFSVSVAAVVNGEPVAAAVYDPIADELFTADGEGAYLNGRRLPSLLERSEEESDLITGFPNARNLAESREEYLDLFGGLVETYLSVRRISSAALSLAYVAAGRADAVLGANVRPWDIAAGSLLVRRVGGKYRGWDADGPTTIGFEGPLYCAHCPGDHFVLHSTAQIIDSSRRQPTISPGRHKR
jgi:myo-inositol-1(or 4)-monophosphatase